jgi:hypothetical protein
MFIEDPSNFHSPEGTSVRQTEYCCRATESSTPPIENIPHKVPTLKNVRKKISKLTHAFETTSKPVQPIIDNQQQQIIGNIPITLNLLFGEGIKTRSFQVNQSSTIKLVIQKAIDEFNAMFSAEKTKLRLKEDIDLYVLKPSKKNGKPKQDMPYFNEDTIVCNCYTNTFSLLWKDNPDVITEMFELDRTRNQMCKGGCLMF